MLPEDIQNKIMIYNIHPVAELLKFNIIFISRKRSNQVYYPKMFRECRQGCYCCHKYCNNSQHTNIYLCSKCEFYNTGWWKSIENAISDAIISEAEMDLIGDIL